MGVCIGLTRLYVDRRCRNINCLPFIAPPQTLAFRSTGAVSAVVSADFREGVGHSGPPFLSLNCREQLLAGASWTLRWVQTRPRDCR